MYTAEALTTVKEALTRSQANAVRHNPGFLDIPTIRDDVVSILEGGKEAFLQRKEKHGFDY